MFPLTVASVVFILLVFLIIILKIFFRTKTNTGRIKVAFFHPYCDAGGGGERVLWMMIFALLSQSEFISRKIEIYIYTGDSKLFQDIIENVKVKFQICLSEKHCSQISLVRINTRKILEANNYPVLTMLFQSLASVIVALECLLRLTPDIYIDTMGAPFTYLVAKCCVGCIVVAYVHYPIISTDMLQKVQEQRPGYNNDNRIASSVTISSLKLIYYKIFAWAYSFEGRLCDVVMVNSSWTRAHIEKLWGRHGFRLRTVYPPCNTAHLSSIPLKRSEPDKGDNFVGSRERVILSVGQFRPEKGILINIDISFIILFHK